MREEARSQKPEARSRRLHPLTSGFWLLASGFFVSSCASPPPRVLAAPGYEIRLRERPDEHSKQFSQKLRELDEKLARVYGIELPEGEVWIDDLAFKEEPIGGTYDWWTDRIVIAERNDDYLGHELVHRYNRYAFGDLPRWLDEGLAYAIGRAGFAALESPAKRVPDFEAIAEVRDARDRSPRSFPSMEELFDDPYANGHLNVRIATVIVDRLLRDHALAPSTRQAIFEVAETARHFTPAEAQRVLERAAFTDFPRPDELRALLADETASDELVATLMPLPSVETLRRAAAPDPRARRRLALLLDRERTREGRDAETACLEELLQDEDPRVVRAAAYSLGARGDTRVLGRLVEALKDAPIFRFVHRGRQGELSYEVVPLQKTLARLAGETPPGIDPEVFDDAAPLPYRVVEAWQRWWDARK